MNRLATIVAVTVILSLFVMSGCGGAPASEPVRPAEPAPEHSSESGERGEHGEGSESGEHGGKSESGEHGEGTEEGEGGEESGAQYGMDETYDEVRAGARLSISYDRSSNTFTGTVENTTGDTLKRVRVEVHLSNGIELGPTTPVDPAPGETADVALKASDQPFDTWSAHPEVG